MKEFLIWMRDKFAQWLASTTAFSFMWISVALAIGVLFVWDGAWSRDQAPQGMELSYQAAGWALRLWVVFGLVGVVALGRRGAWASATPLFVTWLLASIMSYGHALGFMASGQMERYASAQVVTDVEGATIDSAADQIAALDRQKDDIRADRDADVARFEQAITNITSDGLDNDDQADAYRADIVLVQQSARARIEAIDAQIMLLFQSKQDARITASEDAGQVIAFDPLYMWIASAIHTDPSDDQVRTIAARVGGFWAFLIELLAGVGPAILYAASAVFADDAARKRETEKRSEAAVKGHETRQRKARRSGKLLPDEREMEKIELAIMYARTKPHMSANGICRAIFKADIDDVRPLFARWVKSGAVSQHDADLVLTKEITGAPRDARSANGTYPPPAIQKKGADNADDDAGGRADQGV